MTGETNARANRVKIIVTIITLTLNAWLLARVARKEAFEPATREMVRYALFILVGFGGASLIGQIPPLGRLCAGFGKLQITICSMLLGCALLEGAFRVAPSLFPDRLRSEVRSADFQEQKARTVEYLPHAPFAKPKPNVIVEIPGYYGPSEQFEYEWLTDRRGFKNLPEIAAKESVAVVAVGDSYTEGMGVKTEKTWASLLTERGVDTYSLGVQGYAPTQIAGAFEHYGLPLKPRWVIIGYLGGIYQREHYFAGKVDMSKPDALPSAIGRLVNDDIEAERRARLKIAAPQPRELRTQYRYVTVALLERAARAIRGPGYVPEWLKAGVGNVENDPRFITPDQLLPNDKIRIGLMQRYRLEIESAYASMRPTDDLKDESDWQSTLRQFDQIIQSARSANARVLLVMFRNRGTVYAEHATGRALPSDVLEERERANLEKYSSEREIEFLDTKPAFLSAVSKIDNDTTIEEYPYLPVDGHPSPVGHRIIADEIEKRLKYLGLEQPVIIAGRPAKRS